MKEDPSPETILEQALNLADPQARAAWLDEACGGDGALRGEIDSLLAAHRAADANFMDTLVDPVWSEVPGEKAGDTIGRYKLLQQIGEGGFGRVWMAEQREPMQRRVALKIVKPGMDTGEVLGRFEAERQALALMDHPNIAQVFDGGVTETGRPFFVMELVKGVPITEYCDANKLPPRERIDLLRKVCQAVQHAHQKGIIHRDLKPSNILVTVKDDKPVSKVIDFGVAKALDTRLTERTLFTRLNQWIGTPAYMSPEQAGLGSLDIDTRSDVYSLGTILYELLTGRTPFDAAELRKEGYEAILRRIREEDAPKASTRLSTLTRDELTKIAGHRGRSPDKLGHAIRGELDWILLKALERDRTRRYETANALAADLQRYVAGEPITAAPPTWAYQASKFVRKHWKLAGITAAFMAILLSGTGVSIWQAVEANRARNEEAEQRKEAELQRGKAEDTAGALVRLAASNDLDLARRYVDDDDYPSAIAHLCRANRTDPDNSIARCLLLSTLLYGGDHLPPRPISVLKVGSPIYDTQFTPDGKSIIAVDQDGVLHGWDTETGNPLFEPQEHFPGRLAMSEDGSAVVLWNLRNSDGSYRNKTMWGLGNRDDRPKSLSLIVDLSSGMVRGQRFERGTDSAFHHPLVRCSEGRWEFAEFTEEPEAGDDMSRWKVTIHDLHTRRILRSFAYRGSAERLNAEQGLLAVVRPEGKEYLVHDIWSGEVRFPAVTTDSENGYLSDDFSITESGRLVVTSSRPDRESGPQASEDNNQYRTRILAPGDPPVLVREVFHDSPSGGPFFLPDECGLLLIAGGIMHVPERPGSAWDEPQSPWKDLPPPAHYRDIEVLGPTRVLVGNAVWRGVRQMSGRLPDATLAVDANGTRAVVQADPDTLCVYELTYPSALPEIEDAKHRSSGTIFDQDHERRIEVTRFGCRFIDHSKGGEVHNAVSHLGLEVVAVSPQWTRVATTGFGEADSSVGYPESLRIWKFPSGERVGLPNSLRNLGGDGLWGWVTTLFLDEDTLLCAGLKWTADSEPLPLWAVVDLRAGRSRILNPPSPQDDLEFEPEANREGVVPGFRVGLENGGAIFVSEQRLFRLDPWADSPFHLLTDLGQPLESALLSPDGQAIVVLAENGLLSAVDAQTGEVTGRTRLPRGQGLSAFPSNTHVIAGTALLDARTLREVVETVPSSRRFTVAQAEVLEIQDAVRRAGWSGATIAEIEGGPGFQLWMTPEEQPLTPPVATRHPALLVHEGRILASPAKPEGIGGLKSYERLRIWEIPLLEDPLPDWFLVFAEAYAGCRLNTYGMIERVPASLFFEAADRIRTMSQSAAPEVAHIAQWLIAPAPQRTVSPFLDIDREQYLDLLLQDGSALDIFVAGLLETGSNALRLAVVARLACFDGNWPLAEHHLRRAVAMAPEDPEVRRIAAEIAAVIDPNRTRLRPNP